MAPENKKHRPMHTKAKQVRGIPSLIISPCRICSMPLWSGLSLNLGQLFFQQLLVIQVAVVAVQGEQFVVRARLHDASVVQHGDAIGIAHRGNAGRDEDGGVVLHYLAQVIENFIFSASVDAGESVIENENEEIANQRS